LEDVEAVAIHASAATGVGTAEASSRKESV
jgi:hypothetical protein